MARGSSVTPVCRPKLEGRLDHHGRGARRQHRRRRRRGRARRRGCRRDRGGSPASRDRAPSPCRPRRASGSNSTTIAPARPRPRPGCGRRPRDRLALPQAPVERPAACWGADFRPLKWPSTPTQGVQTCREFGPRHHREHAGHRLGAVGVRWRGCAHGRGASAGRRHGRMRGSGDVVHVDAPALPGAAPSVRPRDRAADIAVRPVEEGEAARSALMSAASRPALRRASAVASMASTMAW